MDKNDFLRIWVYDRHNGIYKVYVPYIYLKEFKAFAKENNIELKQRTTYYYGKTYVAIDFIFKKQYFELINQYIKQLNKKQKLKIKQEKKNNAISIPTVKKNFK